MRQVIQNLKSGEVTVEDVPAPRAGPGQVRIQTRASLISSGTERMMVEFGKSSMLGKARSKPEKVKQVLEKIGTEGLVSTLELVQSRLGLPMRRGYCNAGVVLDVGPGVTAFQPGDRVASNGPHAEIVSVPKHLCAKVPDGVTDEQAAFTVLSSIGLQGIRLLEPSLGEKVVVYGLGLIGLISIQLLRAHGCDVLGIDINPDRTRLAETGGVRTVCVAEGADPVAAAEAWTRGRGVDGVLITAAAQTDQIMHHAADMCRKRGRIVLVGVVGLNLRRSDFYEKELTFQVSCSYGPGRYDERYEQGGMDYPIGFVRWTEQRNLEAVLEAMAEGRLKVDDLVSRRFPLEQASEAYDLVLNDPSALGVIFQYPAEVDRAGRAAVMPGREAAAAGRACVGVVGAGNFSQRRLYRSLKKAGADIRIVADLDPIAARHLARKLGAPSAVTDYQAILQDDAVNTLIAAVPHNLHARMVCQALDAGKHVFTEKPMAMNLEELGQVCRAAAARTDLQVMVGFNRRFSPFAEKARRLLAGRGGPLCMNMTVNAGYVPPDHWVQDPVRGGGRIIGEGCHFIDLLAFLAGSPVRAVSAMMVGGEAAVREDKMTIGLAFEDGSVGTVNYFANGSGRYPKETLEVFSDRRTLRLENFRRLVGYGFQGFRKMKRFSQDKGHDAEYAGFLRRIETGGEPLVALDDLVNVTLASFAAVTSAREGRSIVLAQEYAAFLADLAESGGADPGTAC